jgi:superfamily II DNA or RNA helicase
VFEQLEGQLDRLRLLLMRIGEPRLQDLVGKDVVRYLALMGQRVPADRLASVLIQRHGNSIVEDLNRDIRSNLLSALSRTDAEELCRLQGIADDALVDPWQALSSLPYRDGQPTQRRLKEFLGVREEAPMAVSDEPPSEVVVNPAYALHDYQTSLVRSAIGELQSSDRRVLLHMPTGSGKTRCAMSVIAESLKWAASEDAAVIWLAHSEELCSQAAEEFGRCWNSLGIRPANLGRYYGTHEVDIANFRGGVLVAGLQKLYRRSLRFQSDFLKLKGRAVLVVIDEAHQALAPTYQHLLQMLAPIGGRAGLLGLSATPGRSLLDIGQDQKLAAFFARRKLTIPTPIGQDPITFLQAEGYLAVPDYRYVPYAPTVGLSDADRKLLADGLDLSAETLGRLGDDEQRNLLILDETRRLVEEGGRIILFACSVRHARMLSETLAGLGVRAGCVLGETDAGQRRLLIESFRRGGANDFQVLVNYAVLTTGFDAPKTNVAVIARPTQSVVLYSQMLGRALRGPRSGGNEHCKVVTVQDRIPGFRSIYEGFSHWEDVW